MPSSKYEGVSKLYRAVFLETFSDKKNKNRMLKSVLAFFFMYLANIPIYANSFSFLISGQFSRPHLRVGNIYLYHSSIPGMVSYVRPFSIFISKQYSWLVIMSWGLFPTILFQLTNCQHEININLKGAMQAVIKHSEKLELAWTWSESTTWSI